ncbi:ACT domain-containing protein [Octadecabacter sp. G9-8]|uniref:ACT domain-containing protein n=1 Tax=Octadecabacter dasysiphoniae TaxID=2909341 RepID=A0ABS9CY22_9RHOB|nr:ACT domain-containing protein [Octadecabacter dasysiphoniae]MCF2871732.1 ACT domain-containing protein [Octadecabacter dasysiphoniae]
MKLSFTPLIGEYAITRLPAATATPDWVDGEGLVSMTRAQDELSIVCRADRAPDTADRGWSALRVDMLAALDEPGVVLAAVTPISTAGLGVFVISTHLRDYLLVRTAELERVHAALTAAGHTID